MLSKKKITTIALTVACVLSLGVITNASNHSTTLGTSNGSLVWKTSGTNNTEDVNPGSHTCHYNVTSFSFHGGIPSNTFPVGKDFTIHFANIGISKTYTHPDTSGKSKSYSIGDEQTVYAGVESTYKKGLTVYLDWNPNW